MQLPKIITPEYTITLPLLKKNVRFRPFLVKEEKILLTAIEGYNSQSVEDANHLVDAIFQILQSCILTKGIKVDTLSMIDVEFLFLNVRKKSIGETVEVLIRHDEARGGCGEYTSVEVDLNTSEAVFPGNAQNKIMVSAQAGLVLKFPSLRRSIEIQTQKKQVDSFYDIIIESIDTIFDGDDFAPVSSFDRGELIQWLGQLEKKTFDEILAFFESTPYMKTDVSYTCKHCSKPDTVEVKGTTSFFT